MDITVYCNSIIYIYIFHIFRRVCVGVTIYMRNSPHLSLNRNRPDLSILSYYMYIDDIASCTVQLTFPLTALMVVFGRKRSIPQQIRWIGFGNKFLPIHNSFKHLPACCTGEYKGRNSREIRQTYCTEYMRTGQKFHTTAQIRFILHTNHTLYSCFFLLF